MKRWLQASRAYSLTAVLAPIFAVAVSGTGAHWPRLLCAALGAAALLLAVNLHNDVQDDARGIDYVGSLGGSGVIQAKLVSAGEMTRAASVLFFLGLVLGIPTLLAAPRVMLAIGVATAAGAYGYSAALKYTGLGDATVLLFCGPVLTAGASVAAFGDLRAEALWIGLTMGLAAVAILHTNNLQDTEDDAKAGAVTIARLIGKRGSIVYLIALYVAALACARSPWVAFGFIPAALLVRSVLIDPTKRTLRVQAGQAHLAIGVALIIKGVLS